MTYVFFTTGEPLDDAGDAEAARFEGLSLAQALVDGQ